MLNEHQLRKKCEVESPFSHVHSVGSVLLSAMRCSDSLTHVAARYRKGQVTENSPTYRLAPAIRNKLFRSVD